jgi:hypothetical protein
MRIIHMAKNKVTQTTRTVALAIAAKCDLELAARSLGEIQRALTIWADELTVDGENLHQTSVGAQAEAMRLAMSALSVRAASERLAVVAQLATDAVGGAT